MSLIHEEKINIKYPLISDPLAPEDPLYRALAEKFGTEAIEKKQRTRPVSIFRRILNFIKETKAEAYAMWLRNHTGGRAEPEVVSVAEEIVVAVEEKAPEIEIPVFVAVETPELPQETQEEVVVVPAEAEPAPIIEEEVAISPTIEVPSYETIVTGMLVTSKTPKKATKKKSVVKVEQKKTKKVTKTATKTAKKPVRAKKLRFDPLDIRV